VAFFIGGLLRWAEAASVGPAEYPRQNHLAAAAYAKSARSRSPAMDEVTFCTDLYDEHG